MSQNTLNKFPSVRNTNIANKADQFNKQTQSSSSLPNSNDQQSKFYVSSETKCQKTNSDKKITGSLIDASNICGTSVSIPSNTMPSQNEITKRVQNKIRMRKASGMGTGQGLGSDKKSTYFNPVSLSNNQGNNQLGLLGGTENNQEYFNTIENSSNKNELSIQLIQKIQNLWKSSAEIYTLLTEPQLSAISSEQLKNDIIKNELVFILCKINKNSADSFLEQLLIKKIKRKCLLKNSVKNCQQKQINVNHMFDQRIKKLSTIYKGR